MDISTQRRLALKILTFQRESFNLYTEFPHEITDEEDLTILLSFIETYITRHNIDYIDFDEISGDFFIKEKLLPRMLSVVLKLSATNFERISAFTGRCFGYENYFVTKITHDQGIDVICYTNYFNEKLNFKYNIRHYLLGQVKKYKKALVNTDEIRGLTGAVEHFKRKSFANVNRKKLYSRFKIKLHTPFTIYFSSGYFFSEDALKLCENSDILAVDIIDVVFVLVKSINSGLLKWRNQKGTFITNELFSTLEKITVVK